MQFLIILYMFCANESNLIIEVLLVSCHISVFALTNLFRE